MIKTSIMKSRVRPTFSKTPTSQRGMASIIITMVTMVVISLIVLGFATISRREARQTLDQLQSTQAFYAAESAIEDTRKAIKVQRTAGKAVQDKSSCTTNNAGADFAPNAEYPTGDDMIIDADSQTSYTCLQVNANPTSLEFDGIDSESTVVPMTSNSGAIRRVEITWQPTSGTANPAVCPGSINQEFTPRSNWQCAYGVMRVDLSPTDGVMTRGGLTGSSYGAYFQPVNFATGGSDNYSGNTNTPRLVAANCNASTCKAIIDQLPGLTSLSLRLSSIYQPSNIKIAAFNNNGVGGSPIGVSGVQAEIDATGKASDVLRRIKVRVPLIQSNTLLPGSAINSNGSICKRFSTANGYFNVPDFLSGLDPDTSNEMCSAQTSGTLGSAASVLNNIQAQIDSTASTNGAVNCGVVDCVTGGSYHFNKTFLNSSNNIPSQVIGCRWDFGDGTSQDDVKCLFGQSINHTYPTPTPLPAYPAACFAPYRRNYVVTLTVDSSDGTTKSDSRTVVMPNCF
jgi:Tfp pilus assembly protein PilX